MVVVSAWRSDLTVWGWLLGRIDFQCWVLGKEKVENREERGTAELGSAFWRKDKQEGWFCFYRVLEKFFLPFFFFFLILCWKVFFLHFFFLGLFIFLNTVLMKNYRSFGSFGFIYIYIDYIIILTTHLNLSSGIWTFLFSPTMWDKVWSQEYLL